MDYLNYFKILEKKNILRFYLFIFFTFISSALEFLSIGSFYPLLSSLLSETDEKLGIIYSIKNFISNFVDTNDILILLIITLVFLFIIKLIFQFFLILWETNYIKDIIVYLSKRLIKGYLNLDFKNFLNHNSSVRIRNFNFAIESYTGALKAIITLITELLTVFALALLLMIIDFEIAILTFSILLIPVSVVFFSFRKFFLKISKLLADNISNALKHLIQALNSYKEIKIFRKESIFTKNYLVHQKKVVYLNRRSEILQSSIKIIFDLLIIIIFVFLLAYSKLYYGSFSAKLSFLGMMMLVFLRVIPSISKILRSLNKLQKNKSMILELLEDLKNQYNYIEKEENILPIKFNNSIEFKSIFFSHGEKTLFKDANLKIIKGQTVGICGNLGTGKTTIIDILMGYHKPDSGKVLIDGKLITLNTKLWEKKIGYVPQNVNLLDDNIEYNISLENENEKINKKNIKKLISNLDIKIGDIDDANLLGEDGSKISGGQRQKIGIARALYINPKILIMDEATNSMDKKNEKLVLDYIKNYEEDLTCIIISHDLNVLKNCDKIYLLKDFKFEIINKVNN